MNIASIKKILTDNGINIKKKYGQNFLISDEVLQQIIKTADLDKETVVYEIGPGLGALTEYLVKTSKKVICYEIDKDMILILNKRFEQCANIEIIPYDFLVSSVLQQDNNKTKVVANLPYYITTPILLKILEEMEFVDEIIVMMQKEVAMRICGKPSTKDYNALSVLVQYKYNAKLMFDVSRKSFYPEPEVTSSVIKISKKAEYLKANNEKFFYSFNRNIFKQRRKTLVNNLKASYDISKEEIENILLKMKYKISIRSEELTVEEIIKLADAFYLYLKPTQS